jgi:glyceraldehyde-3-phosphate dehydrogenase (NADP+)
LVALLLASLVIEAGWPAEALSLLPLRSADAAPLVEDPRLRMLTFTGSAEVGWDMKRRAGMKKVTLELGGNAGVIIHDDADLEYAAERCAAGGFQYAGQSCISVQRIFIQEKVYERFLELFLPRVRGLKIGPPLDENADLCAMISRNDAERVAQWLAEARAAGARFLCGGEVRDGIVSPTVIAAAAPELKVNCREIFAPVVTVQPYRDFAEALAATNDSEYGLQAGLFTRDVGRIFQAFAELTVGGVMVNEVATWRVDHMPYGGEKLSGTGREGVRYALAEMTEPRLLAINLSR